MAVADLDTVAIAADEVFYIDTSAIFPLVLKRAQKEGEKARIPQTEIDRAARVERFVARALGARAKPRTTVLALEEIAAKYRAELTADEWRTAGVTKWRDFEANDSTAAGAARKRVQAFMLTALRRAADALGALGTPIDRSPVPAKDTLGLAQKLRKYHRALLSSYERLDPMDALHIAVGAEMGASSFVTFDGAWSSVKEITVVR